jgi:class 3 adenylate cyclase
MTALTATVKDEMVRYFQHLGGRVEKAARALPRDKFWVNPFPYGNDMGHLLLHLTGNLSHYVGAIIGATGYVRNRPVEFTDPNRYPPEETLAKFQEAIALVVRIVKNMDEAALQLAVPDQAPIQTRFGLLLVCASHLNNHVGQMSWLVQALGHNTQEPPSW